MDTNALRNLVFEGGGVKGIAYGGALQRLDEMKVLDHIVRVAGTSAGAINATLLAVGCSSQETSEIIQTTHFSSFEDGKPGVISAAIRFFCDTGYGLYKGKTFESWMRTQIEKKTGDGDITFAKLARLASESGGTKRRDLYVVASNLTADQPQIFSAETTPDMTVAHAVRMSMSIPFFFRYVKGDDGHVMVDGGVIYNYPIDLFDRKKYLSNPANGDAKPDIVTKDANSDVCVNHETLGFRLGDAKTREEAEKPQPQKIDSLYDYALALIDYMRQNAQKLHLQPYDWNRTVYIDSSPAKVTEFNLSQKQIAQLIANGDAGVKSYFDWALGPGGPQLPV